MLASSTSPNTAFNLIKLADLDSLSTSECDLLPFGVVGLSPEGLVEVYNLTESKLAGLPLDSVLGKHYFSSTAQCMNNYLVAQRLGDEPELDAVLDYVLTLRMRPTPVRLRLLRSSGVTRRYVLIQLLFLLPTPTSMRRPRHIQVRVSL